MFEALGIICRLGGGFCFPLHIWAAYRGARQMKRKAIQRRGYPVKVRYQPWNAGARWLVFWSGGGYSYFPDRVPPQWVLTCILRVKGIKHNNYVEWRVENE